MSKRSRRISSGMTIVEIAVVVIIFTILLTLVVPSFNRAVEQNRLDAAAQYLRSIWTAERVYWLENRSFTNSMASLDALGLIDPKIVAGSDGSFSYDITASSDSFTVTATRSGSTMWSGSITITESGIVAGSVTAAGGRVLSPPDL